jgi:hypothetical protein
VNRSFGRSRAAKASNSITVSTAHANFEGERKMALLRETEGTIRAYLFLAGVLGGLSNLSGMLSPGVPLWYRLVCAPAIALAGLYLWLGATLHRRLRESPSSVLLVFRCGMGVQATYVVFEVVLAILAGSTPVPVSLIGFAIAFYLHSQSQRLIREAATPAQFG